MAPEKTFDLLKRLRTMGNSGWNPIGNEAADEIESLRQQLAACQKSMMVAHECLHQMRAMISDQDEGHAEAGKAIAAIDAAMKGGE